MEGKSKKSVSWAVESGSENDSQIWTQPQPLGMTLLDHIWIVNQSLILEEHIFFRSAPTIGGEREFNS